MSLFAAIPPEILHLIGDYLDLQSYTYFSSTTVGLLNFFPHVKVISFYRDTLHLDGEYRDKEQHLCVVLPNLPHPLMSIDFKIDWKDQGWGNRKGTLWFRLYRNTSLISKELLMSPAEHDWQTAQVSLNSGSDLIQKSAAGDRLEVWRYVGCGGGHEMFLKNLRIIIKFVSASQSRTN
eukprot:TRINITY_DN4301_c0_g1_i1.p1 TRINITY_DN4301_c0_g1~~TRINITY_DN4301_c0_g1_i1.p1  ORF type:complete len:178 (+),score=17.96 TRINITY_DN4301_c0_g1_i1:61-594(+)